MKKYINHLWGLCVIALTTSMIATSCTDNNDIDVNVEDQTSSFTIKNADNSVVVFEPNQCVEYEVEAVNIVRTSLLQPAGWNVEYDDTTLSITAPQSREGADLQGSVTIRYTGADDVSGEASVRVKVEFDDQDEPNKPTPDGSFEVQTMVNGDEIAFTIFPDNTDAPYQITLDTKSSFLSYGSSEEYMAYDIQYWKDMYGDGYESTLVSGMISDSFTDVPNGTYIVCAYYVDVTTSNGYGFAYQEVVVGNSGPVTPGPGETAEPSLGLAYIVGDGEPFGFVNQGVVVCYVDPNPYVVDWYYGIFRPENCNGLPDEDIRAGLKSLESLHGQNVLVYNYDWNTNVVLCGFWIDAEGNEGPIERIPLVVSLNPSEDCNYEDYIGEWIVSGKNSSGNKVSYEIEISENMRDESYNIFGLTRTGKDRECNAPVKTSFKNGAIVFYESSTLGVDRESGNWLGFLGYAYDKSNPNNKGYFNINHQTIATGVCSGDNIILNWNVFNYEGYTLQYYTFVYGYLTEDEYREESFFLYEEDLRDYIVSDMTITKKGASTANVMKKTFVRCGFRR